MDLIAFLTPWFEAGFAIGASEVFQLLLALLWAFLGY
jgi:hypothetical protein